VWLTRAWFLGFPAGEEEEMLVLFETPAGFALFKVLDEGKLSKVEVMAAATSLLSVRARMFEVFVLVCWLIVLYLWFWVAGSVEGFRVVGQGEKG
jgi:hypothetical protein